METAMQAQLVSAAQQLEQQLDDEISRLDRLGTDDLENIRRERIAEMKRMKEKRHQWHANVSPHRPHRLCWSVNSRWSTVSADLYSREKWGLRAELFHYFLEGGDKYSLNVLSDMQFRSSFHCF